VVGRTAAITLIKTIPVTILALTALNLFVIVPPFYLFFTRITFFSEYLKIVVHFLLEEESRMYMLIYNVLDIKIFA